MFGGSSHTKLPHILRLIILFLRVALGLSFFYLGFTSLFNPQLGLVLQGRSLSGVYAWVNGMPSGGWLHPFVQWAFLVIGACLVAGLATRLAALLAVVLILEGYLPSISYTLSNVIQFVNDELVVILASLVLIAARAGEYIGLDAFIHIGLHGKKKE
jgi:uncharacterized membrane protein YphA (DoxX/SURF4 family)